GPGTLGDEPVPVPAVASVFAAIVDSKSPYTAGHSERVGALSGAMAEELGAPVSLLVLAGLLHDLGKLAVPNTILDHPGSLDEAAWALIRRHPADSARVLRTVDGWEEVARIAAVHHERPDGRGYHRELEEQDLPRFGTWLAAVDSFDAMTADRPYRDGMDPDDALEELRRGAGTQFTHEAVETLEAVIEAGSVGGQHDRCAVA
ncbi:MAG: HD-GYP domain-containing protein, partial [Acidobacteriota bacterium]